MDIIYTLSTQEIIIQNICQMRFLEKLVLKQNVDKKLIMNAINFSMLDSTSSSDDDAMNNRAYKLTLLEHTMNHVM